MDQRTAYSATFRNADGTLTTAVSASPVHYRDTAGAWQPISSAVKTTAAAPYLWRNEANSFQVAFKPALADDYVRFQVAGKTFALSLSNAAPSAGVVTGAQVLYPAALAGADLRYEVVPEGFKETFVLKASSVPATFRFTLTPPAGVPLEAKKQADGSWAFLVAPEPEPLFVLGAPVVTEQSKLVRDSSVAALSVTPDADRFAVVLSLDRAWLEAPGRRFPVELDPTVTLPPPSEDAVFLASCPSCPGYPWDRLWMASDSDQMRSAIKFDLSSLPTGITVTDAKLKLYFDELCSVDVCGAHQIDAHAMTSAWTVASTSAQIAFNAAPAASFTLPANATAQWMSWTITSLVSDWLSGAQPNHGLLLKRSTEPANAGGPSALGRRYAGEPTLRPQLEVTYAEAIQLNSPTTLYGDGADLSWGGYQGTDTFGGYEVHRSATANFTPSPATRIQTIADVNTTTFRDTNATASSTVSYKIVVNGRGSNEQRVTLPALGATTRILQPDAAAGKSGFLYYRSDVQACMNTGVSKNMYIGSASNAIYRPVLSFDLSAIPPASRIDSAKLSLWNRYAPKTAATVEVHRLTRSWTEGTGDYACTADGATWYKYNGVANWTIAGGDFDSAVDASLVTQGAVVASWHDFDVSSLVQQWVSGAATNNGLLLKKSDETLGVNNGFTYLSDDWTASPTLRPKLAITFSSNPPPGPPQLDSPAHGASVETYAPGLKVTAGAQLDYWFDVATDSAFGTIVASSGWLPRTNTFAVAPGLLVEKTYYWRAKTRDSLGAVSGWSETRSFNVRVSKLGSGGPWPTWSQGPFTVNVVNGNALLTLPGPGYPTASGAMGAAVAYNSLNLRDQGLGRGWALAAAPLRLIDHSGLSGGDRMDAVEVVVPDGSSSWYARVGASNTYLSPTGTLSRLSRNVDGTFTLVDDDTIWSFRAPNSTTGEATLTASEPVAASPGQARTTYAFSAQDPSAITTITDPAGRTLTFTWNKLNPTGCSTAVLCVTGPDSVTWRYIGSASGGTAGDLSVVNNGTRDLVKATYDGSGRVYRVRDANDLNPGGATPGYNVNHVWEIAYDGAGRAQHITELAITGQAPGYSRWSFTYSTGEVETSATRVVHEGVPAGTIRTGAGFTKITPPREQGKPDARQLEIYYDAYGRELERRMTLRNGQTRILSSAWNTHDLIDWAEAEDGDPLDLTWDLVNEVPLREQGSDPDGPGPLGTRISDYRYDEKAIGTVSSEGPALQGLQAAYFDNLNLAGRPKARQTDANVDFSWGSGGPSALGSQTDNFSVRWSGNLVVTSAGSYTFSTVSDEGVRLVVDNLVAIDKWQDQTVTTHSSSALTLSAGTHTLALEYYERTGPAEVHLRWACTACNPTVADQVIPASALRPGWMNQTSGLTPAGRLFFQHYAKPDSGRPDYTLVQVGGQNHITSFDHDTLGRLTQKVMPKGNSARTIDADGNLGGTPNGTYATTWAYYGLTETAAPPAACGGSGVGQAGLVKSETPNGIAATTLVYDTAGRPLAFTKAVGATCRFYTAEGRLTEERAPGETSTTSRRFTYDPAGAVRTVVDASGTVTLEYDEAGRVERSLDSFGAEAQFVYDAESNLIQRKAAVGAFGSNTVYTSSYAYDEANALTSLTDPAGRAYVFSYDVPGRLKTIQYPNGTYTWIDYTVNGWEKARYARHGTLATPLPSSVPADANPIVDYSYEYNLDGQRTREDRSGGGIPVETTSYAYDNLGRLETVSFPDTSSRKYCFDLDSNRSKIYAAATAGCTDASPAETYVYDPANPNSPGLDQLTSWTKGTTKNFTYRADGETTTRGADTLSWDTRGRSTGGTFGGTSLSYTFDPLGRWRTRTAAGTTTQYRYAGPGEAALFETTTAGTITLTAVEGPAGDLADYAGPPTTGSTVSYRYYNGHGDLAATTDTSGNRTNAYTYDPFGAPSQTQPANAAVERWTGRWSKKLDTTSSFIQMGVRPYDPAIGRFLARDPIVGGSLNLYDYAAQDPINGYDLSGRGLALPIGAGGGVGSVGAIVGLIIAGKIAYSAFEIWLAESDDSEGADADNPDDDPTAGEIIARDKVGSINREFPGEFRDKTLPEIIEAARSKGERGRRAKKAMKLLTDSRFDKRRR